MFPGDDRSIYCFSSGCITYYSNEKGHTSLHTNYVCLFPTGFCLPYDPDCMHTHTTWQLTAQKRRVKTWKSAVQGPVHALPRHQCTAVLSLAHTHFLFLCWYQITTIGAFQQLLCVANDGKIKPAIIITISPTITALVGTKLGQCTKTKKGRREMKVNVWKGWENDD